MKKSRQKRKIRGYAISPGASTKRASRRDEAREVAISGVFFAFFVSFASSRYTIFPRRIV
jgi:hypothetical protein